jgi:hypothetical protein
MPYIGKKPADIIATAVDTTTGTFSGDIDVDGTTNLDVVDIDGAVDMASTLGVAGVVTANAGVVVDNITIDGTTIALSSGDFTLDVAGDIILDADNGVWRFKDAGTTVFMISRDGNSYCGLYSDISNMAMRFQGNDGGSLVTALTLDMANGGAATLSNGLTLTDGNLVVANGHGIDFSAAGNAGGMSSELLDDYEEGTFTATIVPDVSGSITLGTDLMRYTKVGRLVTVSGLIVCSAISSPVGHANLHGLPFTVNNNTDGEESGYSSGSIHIQLLASDIGGIPQLNISKNSTVIGINGFNGTGNTTIADNFGATTQIRICATYTV